MTIPDLRDIIIIIYGIFGIIVFITLLVLAAWLYNRTRKILDNIETTSGEIKNMVVNIKEKFIDPATQFMTMIMGLRQIIEVIKQFFQRDQGGSNG